MRRRPGPAKASRFSSDSPQLRWRFLLDALADSALRSLFHRRAAAFAPHRVEQLHAADRKYHHRCPIEARQHTPLPKPRSQLRDLLRLDDEVRVMSMGAEPLGGAIEPRRIAGVPSHRETARIVAKTAAVLCGNDHRVR